ncbi:MAG: hypothetical protein MSS66_01025 [Selenomonadaceae bacterium]|nr:hypothetical protein [Selenomonadaceae bacterium]
MMFFIIAASVMSLLIVSIHRLARHFGYELPLSSLVLCGLCAMVINFVIISVTPFLTKSYYYTAGAMITFAALGTTCYNKYLLHRKLRLAGSEAISPAELEAVPPPEPQDEALAADALPEVQDEPDMADDATPEVQDEPGMADDATPEVQDEPGMADDTTQDVQDEPGMADYATPEVQDEPDMADDTTPEVQDEPPMSPAGDVADEAYADDDIAATLAAMTTMDQLLDFAFEHNMQKNHPVALAAYQEALKRYSDDSYAPFIVVSITNIHKELGNYQAAIDSIQAALQMPALLANEAARRQFQDTLLYLSAVQEVLDQAGLGSISFKDIPKQYMSKIESIYNSRKPR